MKAQGLTLNLIVLAALALIILSVLIFIFSGTAKKFAIEAQEKTEMQPCPGVITSVWDCEKPIPGNFGRTGELEKLTKLKINEVCCEKEKEYVAKKEKVV